MGGGSNLFINNKSTINNFQFIILLIIGVSNFDNFSEEFLNDMSQRYNNSILNNDLDEGWNESLNNYYSLMETYTNSLLNNTTIADDYELNNNLYNKYEVVTSFGVSLSSSYLEFSPDTSEVRRVNSSGCYPAAFAFNTTLLSSITIELTTASKRDSYFSFGIVVYDNMPSAELETCVGKIYSSWGILDRRNNLQPSEIWEEGKLVRKNRSLEEGDRLSLFLDLRY